MVPYLLSDSVVYTIAQPVEKNIPRCDGTQIYQT